MKITPGPAITRYAEKFGIAVDEVVAWVSDFVHHPGDWGWIEQSEKERAKSIVDYMRSETK